MKQLNLLFFSLIFSISTFAQEGTFTASINTDSLLMDNYLEVSFSLNNAAGSQFEAPSFEGFQIVGGPNQSSSFQMVNGDVNQEITYSYYLQPIKEGTFYIEPAYIQTEAGMLETLPLEVNVYPNPDGIQQNPTKPRSDFHFFDFPKKTLPPGSTPTPKKPKKKRKIYRL